MPTPTEYGRRPVSCGSTICVSSSCTERTHTEEQGPQALSTLRPRYQIVHHRPVPYLILGPITTRDDQTCLCDDPARRRWQG